MAAKLTKAQARVLGAITDWLAAYEVAERLFDDPDVTARRGVQKVLGRLVTLGYAKLSVANATYRITDAGRTALSQHQGDSL
jgi:hypothetical protein